MECYTPSLLYSGSGVNPYSYGRMRYRWRVYVMRAAHGGLGADFYADVLSFYMELRFLCVRSDAMVELADQVYEFLNEGLEVDGPGQAL